MQIIFGNDLHEISNPIFKESIIHVLSTDFVSSMQSIIVLWYCHIIYDNHSF